MEFDVSFYLALEEFLHDLPNRIIERGLRIVDEGAYGDIIFNPKSYTLKISVHGTHIYEVCFNYNRDLDMIRSVTCTCPYSDYCKHMASFAFIIQEELRPILLKEKKVLSAKSKMKTKLKRDTKTKTSIITGPSISVISEELHGHNPKTRGNKLPYNTDFEHILIGDNEVVTKIYELEWSGNRTDLHEVTFKAKDTGISIKCATCNYTKKLCQKAFDSLDDLMRIIHIKGEDILDYRTKANQIAYTEELDENMIDNLFTLEITSEDLLIKPKSPSVLMPQLIDIIKKNLQNNDDAYDESYAIDQLTNSINIGEAMVWTNIDALNRHEPLFLISGKTNQAGDKLSSHYEKLYTPILFEEDKKILYQKLINKIEEKYLNKNMDTTTYVSDEMIECLKENISILQDTIQYTYNPQTNTYHDPERIRKMDFSQFQFSDKILDVKIKASKENGLYILRIEHVIDGNLIVLSEERKVRFYLYFLVFDRMAYIYNNANILGLHLATSGKDEMKFLPRNKNEFFQILAHFELHYQVERDESLEDQISYISQLSKRITLKENGHFVLFYPELVSSDNSFNVLNSILKIETTNTDLPDPEEMSSFAKKFRSLHPKFESETSGYSFVPLHRDDYIKNEWHINFFETCRSFDIEIVGIEEFKNLKFSAFKAEIKTEVSSSIDWFELDVILSFGDEKVDRKKWIKAIKAGQKYVELEDGSIGLLPEEWYNKMRRVITLSEVSSKGLRINKLRFNVIDELFDEIKDKSILEDINHKRESLKSYNSTDRTPLPKNLKAILRPYQEESYQWLKFLEACSFGGILADDMGLGKTLQIICLLASAKEDGSCHALVVVPKSLLFNWANEIEKFYPDLTYHIHHGTSRHENMDARDKADIVISTYGTVTKDIISMREKVYTHIVLDESQAIKNPTSKRYKAIRLLQSPFKLCVTGTPIQNNTFDLYAQATFTNPGLLGNQSFFRQNFATPIDKEGDNIASELLLKMINPFLLRRTKEQVAKDLPDKIESTMHCEMLPHQRKMYIDLKEQIRRDILSLDDDDSQLKFKVLDGLLRLRQLCNSPLLVDKTLTGKKSKSAKIEALISTLTGEIGDGNALVFSQFVQMLSLIRKELDDLGISYAYLDGSTRDREAAVAQFMEDDNCKIFLISLKAGNTGLNLTKAQYVFIVDPWWNPAVEAQAIDRTHRIGQSQKVFAYKMICNDSIEEKILLLQSRKSKVAKKIIQADESSFKNMNKNEIMELLN